MAQCIIKKPTTRQTMEANEKLQAGQSVWIVEANRRPNDETIPPTEVKIKSVGRKYITIDDRWETKFDIETGREKIDSNYPSFFYLSLKEIEDERDFYRVKSDVESVFSGYGSRKKLTHDQYKRILNIINEPPTNGN